MDNKTSTPSAATQQPAISRGYYIFIVAYLVGLSAFGSFVNDMYIPTLPEMTRWFHCSVSVVQLGLTTGMIGLGVGQLILGPVSDKYGRKPVLVTTLILFIAAAVASVFSPTIHVFLTLRFFQGLGASGGYFLARTIPADTLAGRPLAKMMALIGAINGFAPAAAPVVGGAVADSLGWRGIFWILAGFSTLLLLIALPLKESLPPSRRFPGRLLKSFGEYKILLKNKKFIVHVLLKGAALGLLFSYISAAPFIIETHFGYTALEFGGFMGFNALFVAAGATIAVRFKVLKRAAYVGGLVLMLATAVETAVLLFIDDFWAFEIALLPMLFSMGMIFTVGNTLSMNEGRDHAGSASALLGLGGYIFGAVAAPLVGLGDIMHSSAIVFFAFAVLTLIFSYGTKRMPIDPNMVKK